MTHEYSSAVHDARNAASIVFQGGYLDSGVSSVQSARALKVNSSQLDYWVERQIDIEIGTKIIIMTGAYWFVPAKKATVP